MKVLTIGNSFTDSLGAFFPSVSESAGVPLHFERANHGGCELHRHWEYITNEERGIYRMYQDFRFKLREILERTDWDFVTIQQASHASWDESTYQPYASQIHDYIRSHAPGAEILIQQTWAYRSDDPRLLPGGAWGFDQNGMYERLTAAYRKLGETLHLRIIPSGYAVQLARRKQTIPFVPYPPEEMNTLQWPDLPGQAGSLVGKIWWKKNPETGEMQLDRDTIHLNERGQYLQACVWFAFLSGRKTTEITFVPPMIGAKDAAFLRTIAQEAVDTF